MPSTMPRRAVEVDERVAEVRRLLLHVQRPRDAEHERDGEHRVQRRWQLAESRLPTATRSEEAVIGLRPYNPQRFPKEGACS